jgi:hypothetical protein
MPLAIDLPPQVLARVERELDQGEALLWWAQPDPRRMARQTLPIQIVGIVFTLMSLGFVVIPLGLALVSGLGAGILLGLIFSVCSLPFVAIGIAMMSAPLWARRAAGRTAYVLTDRRAIIFGGGLHSSTRSFSPQRLGDVERVDRSDGSGDLIFDRHVSHHHGSRRRHGSHHVTPIGFLGITDVHQVDKLIRDLVAAHG